MNKLTQEKILGTQRRGARAKNILARTLFTSCTPSRSLLEKNQSAAKIAVPGDVILSSSACSSFNQFRKHQYRGEVCPDAEGALAYAACGIEIPFAPQYAARRAECAERHLNLENKFNDLRRVFLEEKPRREKNQHITTKSLSHSRTPNQRRRKTI